MTATKCLLLLAGCLGLYTTRVGAFSIGLFGKLPIHEEITREALQTIAVDVSDAAGTMTFRFSQDSIEAIIAGNKSTDYDQTSAEKHFDNESFLGSSRRLLSLKRDIIANLTSSSATPQQARVDLGMALHTVQDFYAHSSWVELGRRSINRDLGRTTMENPPENASVCAQIDGPMDDHQRLGRRGLPGPNEVLTSGYYFVTALNCDDYMDNHPGKVLHGYIFPVTCDGINKDTPERPNHAEARRLAVEATVDFVNQILSDARIANNVNALKALMDSVSTGASLTWVKGYGIPAIFDAQIQELGSGGYLLSGARAQWNAASYLWLVRLDTLGRVLWQRRYQGTDVPIFANLEKTSDGGCIAVGRWAAPVAVWKLDADGGMQWAKRYSWPHVLSLEGDIKQTRDGGYVVTPGSSAGLGLFKLSRDGSVEWGKRVTEPGIGGPTAVAETTDGGFLLTGIVDLDGRPSVVLKFSAAGELLWQRRYDGQQSPAGPAGHFNDITPTSDGGALAVGDLFHGFNSWAYKAWVVKLSNDGTVDWQREYGNISNQNAPAGGKFHGVTQCRDGTFIIGGSSDGIYQEDNIWIVRLSCEGAVINARSYDCLPWAENGGRPQQMRDGGFITTARFPHSTFPARTHTVLKLASDLSISSSCPSTIGRLTDVSIENTATESAQTFLTPTDLIPTSSDVNPDFVTTTESESTVCDNSFPLLDVGLVPSQTMPGVPAFAFSFPTIQGKRYIVEHQLALSTIWTDARVILGDGNIANILEDMHLSGQRLFRVRCEDVLGMFHYPIGPPYAALGQSLTKQLDDDGWYVAQDFGDVNASAGGKKHLGEDWNSERGPSDDLGKAVFSVGRGTVVYAQDAGSTWGGVIIIHHTAPQGPGFQLPDGQRVSEVWSLYGHLDSNAITQWVNTGGCNSVEKNRQIGIIGPPPVGSTGPHLHLEIRFLNPAGLVGTGYADDIHGWVSPTEFLQLNK